LFWDLQSRSGYAVAWDFFARIFTNDFQLNLYYYFWTTFWYIPLLIPLVLLFLGFFHVKNFTRITVLLYFILLVLVFELGDYWHLNSFYKDVSLYSDNVNLLLVNSINKYHPLLFYVSLLLLFVRFIGLLDLSMKTSSQRFYYSLSVPHTSLLFNTTCVIIFTLFLGSWWAVQEGSWGGWWNWDPSEVFGLVVMVFTLNFLHQNFPQGGVTLPLVQTLTSVLLLLCMYTFIQLNFNLVSHNFGLQVSQFTNTAQFFTILLLLYITIIYWTYVRFSRNSNDSILINWDCRLTALVTRRFMFKYLVIFLTTTQLLLSFYPLINDYLWQLVGFNLTITSVNIYLVTPSLLVLTLPLLWRVPTLSTTAILYFVSQGVWFLVFLIIITVKWNIVKIQHLLLVIFILASYLVYDKVFSCWTLLDYSTNVTGSGVVNTRGLTSYNIMPSSLEAATSLFQDSYFLQNAYNFFSSSSSPEINTFTSFANLFSTVQQLSSNPTYKSFLISVFDSSLLHIFSVLLLVGLSLGRLIVRNMLIIF